MKNNQIRCKCSLFDFFFLSLLLMPPGALSVVQGGAIHNEGSCSRAPLCKHGEWEQGCRISPRQMEVWTRDDAYAHTHKHTAPALTILGPEAFGAPV